MSKVAIIGGGAAGMLCGVYAARRGHQVHILEKNEKLGKKLFITGKGCQTVNFFTALSTPMEAEM